MSSQPQGTFLPNTKVTVGSHRVVIEKYLSEGGFAHVYVVRIPRENNKHEIAVLKRVAVPDKDHLANMRTEVETMKKLKGHKHIVTYIDSHASQLKGGGYEVFLLMEYCSGGGLIDFMNTRLQHRLTEPEILKIFGDCAEGVACMHYLKPPLLHRDLKVENVLISKSASGTPMYKICDFGSTAPPRPAAKTVEEGRLIEEDVQKHTTMQYRSPEMIDVWRKHSINEKADIWALGVLLYKLCYYTTPFEDVGQMAILNARYKFPNYPSFSERLKKLIGSMLKENPDHRPNIYQVLKEVCSMRGTEVPIKDIYATRSQSEVRRNESLPSTEAVSAAAIGLQKTAPQVQVQAIPDVAPMRRGRPTAPSAQGPVPVAAASAPTKGDPFAALDSKNYDVRAGAVDELSKRFPSLNEFSIAHDGGKVSFPSTTSPKSNEGARSSLNERVTNVLADEAFAIPQSKSAVRDSTEKLPKATTSSSPPKPKPSDVRESQKYAGPPKPVPMPAGVAYASTGTGTSPPPSKPKKPEMSSRTIWRVPDSDRHRATSQPRASEASQTAAAMLQPSLPPSQRPAVLDLHRSKSQTAVLDAISAPLSSRPSLEGQRPAAHELGALNISRARSVNSRSRPTSMYVDSNMDYLRDQEQSKKRPSLDIRRHSRQENRARDSLADESAIDDDMDFLRNSEEPELPRRRSKHSHGHHARASLHALSGAKHVAGRFGDALKRFEPTQYVDSGKRFDPDQHGEVTEFAPGPYSPSGRDDDKRPINLSTVSSANTIYTRASDVGSTMTETEDLPPEVRRELERRRLSQEEKRVAEAAAEYRARVANQGTGGPKGPSKASTIQQRVQTLLDEGRQSPVARKTAEGYGRYTDSGEAESKTQTQTTVVPQASGTQFVARRPPTNLEASNNPYPRTRQPATELSSPNPPAAPYLVPAQTAPAQRVVSRPSAPPKPQALRSQWPPSQSSEPEPTLPPRPSGLASLLAKDLEGTAGHPSEESSSNQTAHASTFPPTSVDEMEDFSKRYPSLSGIEMVETEIDGGGRRLVRVKDA